MESFNHNPLLLKMFEHEEGCAQRIQHFLKVWSFSKMIGELEGLDRDTQFILETSAIVHDIGIKPSIEKYNSSEGKYQEIEGPPIVEKVLGELGYDKAVTGRVSFLVGHHHTYDGVEGLDWRILLEADFMVNSYEMNESKDAIVKFREKVFRTESGIRLLNIQSGITE